MGKAQGPDSGRVVNLYRILATHYGHGTLNIEVEATTQALAIKRALDGGAADGLLYASVGNPAFVIKPGETVALDCYRIR